MVKMTLSERFRDPRWPLLLLCIFTWCLLQSLVVAEEDYIDMDEYLGKVRKQWGLADTTATLGKLFRYHIPADAFLGDIDHFEVKESTSDDLPKWLHFNDGIATLEGLPTAQDVGQFYVTVVAVGKHSTGERNSAEDVFSIEVLPASRKSEKSHWLKDASSSAPLRCDSASDVTLMTITLEGDLNAMDSTSRILLANRTMKYFKLSKEQLLIMPVDEELFDVSNFSAGHGNAFELYSSGVRLQWPVGCSLEDNRALKTTIDILEKSSSDGTLADALGLPVIGWQLSTAEQLPSRKKRQEPTFENHTSINSAPARDPKILENLPEIPILGIEKTREPATKDSLLMEGRILPTSASLALYLVETSTFLSDMSSLSSVHTKQDFSGVSTGSTSVPAHVESTSSVHIPSAEPSLMSSIAQPSVPRTETVPLPEVISYQPTRTVVATVDTLTISTVSTTQMPQSPQPYYKLEFQAGHVSRFLLPQNDFANVDGNFWALRLTLTNMNGTSLPNSSWIQVDSPKREIYALPLATEVGKQTFLLQVSDLFLPNTSSQRLVEVTVREDPRSSIAHHEFVMLVRYDVHRYHFAVDWQSKLIKKLVTFFGDEDDSNILVRSTSADPVVLAWTNTSLPAHPCPREAIVGMLGRMAYKGEGISTLPMRKVMLPEFRVHKVMMNLAGECEPEPEPESNATANAFVVSKPEVRNHIDLINATQGRMLRFVVPADTFFDAEDGGTRNLSLRFLTISGLDVPESSWIQFLPSLQEFRGLPMATDVGRVQYQLVAFNGRNDSVADVFIIVVARPASTKPPSVEFSLRLDTDFQTFDGRPNNKYGLLYKLAKLYNDTDPRHITVRNVAGGSSFVVFIWTNSTLPSEPCPAESIGRLVRIMFNPDGTLSRRLTDAFSRGHQILGAEVIPGGVCLADVTPTKVSVGPSSTAGTEHAYAEDDVYIGTVVPAVVIAAMLVVAALVACALYRNKRKGKVTADEDSPFVSKGIPIIFAEELLDVGPTTARTSKEEKPLLPPPKYHQSSGGSGASSPQGEPEHDSSSEAGSGPDEEAENSPRYQPPPPLAANVDTSVNRPKHTPNYRLPPPYVPP